MTDDVFLAQCKMCDEFHFTDDDSTYLHDHCEECMHAANMIRVYMEKRGGTAIVVGGTIRVRTRAQMRDPVERRAWWEDKGQHWRES